MACVKRFDLSKQDLASLSANSLMTEIVTTCATPLRSGDMTAAQQEYLTNWIKALFVDEEIRDELMLECQPQDFYRLVPNLFKAAIIAYRAGHLSKAKLDGGLERRSLSLAYAV
jgi:hypothetical protein